MVDLRFPVLLDVLGYWVLGIGPWVSCPSVAMVGCVPVVVVRAGAVGTRGCSAAAVPWRGHRGAHSVLVMQGRPVWAALFLG